MSLLHYVGATGIILVMFTALLSISPYYTGIIVGDSMNPSIESHDIAVVKETKNVDEGDVVDTYIPKTRYEYDVIHEVKSANETHIITKGTNNDFRDPPTRRQNIDGKIVYVISPPDQIKDVYIHFVADSYAELSIIEDEPPMCIIDSPLGGDLRNNILKPFC